MIYSFSRLILYEQCPFRFYLKYIEEREEPMTKPLALGKAVHKAIERIIDGADFEDAILKGWAEAEFHPEVSREVIGELIRNVNVYRGMGQAELHFQLALDDDPFAHHIQGYIDLVLDDRKIIDWKTDWRPYHVLDSYQLSLYAWALMKMKGISSVNGKLYFLRFRLESGHVIDERDAVRARIWALGLSREIVDRRLQVAIDQDLTAHLFPPRPSSLCNYCPFAIECYQRHSPVYIKIG